MTDPTSPQPPRWLSRIIIVLVPLGSFLSFSIQPLVGKSLLPTHGGSAQVWLASITFFQLALLAGYYFAARIARKPGRVQGYTMIGLAAVSLLLTWLVPSFSPPGFLGIFYTLTLRVGPAMLLLFSISPLMHAWLRDQHQGIPYYLYGLSNLGSFAGLLLYPLCIERNITLSDQTFYWNSFFTIAAGLVAVAGYYFTGERSEPIAAARSLPLESHAKFLLVSVSALTTISMLSATGYIAGEIGSTPLTWVGPFGIYILSFAFIFSGLLNRWTKTTFIGWLAIAISGYVLAKGLSAVTVSGTALWWLLALTAGGSFLGNSILYHARSREDSGAYYLCLAWGGAIGGFCSLLILPNVFSQPFEFLVSSCALLAIGILSILPALAVSTRAVLALAVFTPIFGLVWSQTHQENPANQFLHFRNVYGFTTVNITDNGTILSSETTTHGTQVTKTAESRRHPTLYYSESTGVGRVLTTLKARRPSINIGVVGLGAGTLAAYARSTDTITFWDIDPKAIRIAKKYFTYLSDCAGVVKIQQEDGRKGIEKSPVDFDVLVIDAFCGDSIPSHMITKEALLIYRQRLAARKGILLIHASNRYSSLFPTISSTARSINTTAINVVTEITDSTPELDYDKTITQYIVVVGEFEAHEIATWFPLDEDKGRVKRTVNVATLNPNIEDIKPAWTDNFSSELDVLQVGRYLGGDH